MGLVRWKRRSRQKKLIQIKKPKKIRKTRKKRQKGKKNFHLKKKDRFFLWKEDMKSSFLKNVLFFFLKIKKVGSGFGKNKN